MTSLYVELIVRAIMNFPGSHGYSIIKNLLALPKQEAVGHCNLRYKVDLFTEKVRNAEQQLAMQPC